MSNLEPQCRITPYLGVRRAAEAIAFYKAAFNAEEIFRLTDGNGKIGHAELRIGGQTVMLAEEYPDFGAVSPVALGGTPVKFHILVEDAESQVEKAIAAGATLTRPLADEFYGERSAMITDPFGHQWFIAQTLEDVSPQEMQRRWQSMMDGH